MRTKSSRVKKFTLRVTDGVTGSQRLVDCEQIFFLLSLAREVDEKINALSDLWKKGRLLVVYRPTDQRTVGLTE